MRVNDFYYSLITVALTLNYDWNDMLQIPQKRLVGKVSGLGGVWPGGPRPKYATASLYSYISFSCVVQHWPIYSFSVM